jgi:type II secretory pathway pseudopilin PulG
MTTAEPAVTTSASLIKSEDGIGLLMVLLAVLALSIAAATFFAVVKPTSDTARENITQARLDLWKSAMIKYRAHNAGGYPASLSVLQGTNAATCNVNSAGGLNGFCGPYINSDTYSNTELMNDAWGSSFSYNSTAGTLSSCGSDRVCGNTDDWKVSF